MIAVSLRCVAGMALALVIGPATRDAQLASRQIDNRSLSVVSQGDRPFVLPSASLRLQLPNGWTAFEADYSVMHYRDVFLCINNIGSRALRVEDRVENGPTGTPRRVSYGPEGVAAQLPVGAVYIDIAFFEGPGGGPSFSRDRRDTFESTVRSISPSRSWQTSQLTAYEIEFFKWGRRWSVVLYCREPVAEEDKQAAFDLLRSITFIDRPITSAVRAEAAAFDSLPKAVRDSVMLTKGDAEPCCCGGVNPTSEPRDSGFQVVLAFGKRRWTYFVSREGAVSLIGRGSD